MKLLICDGNNKPRRDSDFEELHAIAQVEARRRVPCSDQMAPQQAAMYEDRVDTLTKSRLKEIRIELKENGEAWISPYSKVKAA